MHKKSVAVIIVDGITAAARIVSGLIEIACEVDQTIEQRKKTKELEKQTEIMREETKARKEALQAKMEEERKRTAIIRAKKLEDMTPEERLEFEASEMLSKINIRLEV